MNNDSNNCPKKSEGQNWEILLFARWMQGAVNMRYMPCKIPELGRSFPCLSRCILTRSNLTSSMLRRRSSFSTWSVGSLQSSPPTFLVRSQIHKIPKFSFPLPDQESSNRYSGTWFRNMQNQPQRAANILYCITVSTRQRIPRQILPKSCRIRDEKGGTGDVYTKENGLGNAIPE